MKLALTGIFIFGLFSVPLLAQGQGLWNGVEFGMSPAAVIGRIGKPRKDTFDRASFKPALAGAVRERRDFRKLTYEKPEGWEKVVLSFLDDRLIGIEMWPKNKTIEAADLPQRFKTDFLLVEAFAKGMDLSALEGEKETSVPKVYPAIYNMLAVRNDRYVIASINNGSFKAIFKDGFKKPTIKKFPGYVENISIVLRTAGGK